MLERSDVLIGLDVGTSTVQAAAFDPEGRELGAVAVANRWQRVGDAGLEQDPAETWQIAARALRRLADRMPGLARRTAALALTGDGGGLWLIDEDGDPVAPGLSPRDGRAGGIVRRWRETGCAEAVAAITGTVLDAAAPSAQIARLLLERPDIVTQAASALQGKDWLYLCCTGERATDPATACATFGDWRTGAHDGRVLDLLDLHEASHLLPAAVDGASPAAPLSAAGAAVTSLLEGTPVVLGPPRTLATALALGLGSSGGDAGATLLGPVAVHMRAVSDPDAAPVCGPWTTSTARLFPDTWIRSITTDAAEDGLDWLFGLIEQVIGAAGLIGVSHGDLVALFNDHAARAVPGRLAHRAFSVDGGSRDRETGAFRGLSAETTPWDLARAMHEEIALTAARCHGHLGDPPSEVRLAPGRYDGALARQILAACLPAPLRVTRRRTPAAAGAALIAARALGHHAGPDDAAASWTTPWLGEPEPVDPALRATYATTG